MPSSARLHTPFLSPRPRGPLSLFLQTLIVMLPYMNILG
jgi:hypothetical protein